MNANDVKVMQSDARSPDLDWSQVRETVRMLNLSVAQIEMAMREGDDSIQTLTESFTMMIDHVNNISNCVTDTHDSNCDSHVTDTVKHECQMIGGKIHDSIMAFQFYDKLSQRLQHVNQTLAALADLVDDQQRLYSPFEWRRLQEMIRSGYSMKEEQEMFDAVLHGATVDHAIRQYHKKQADDESNTTADIELF